MSWEAWGVPEYMEWPPCETCEGAGEVTNDYDREVTCPDCAGMGYIAPDDDPCDDDVI